jgi:acetyltransferase-like isoleucine patch superfamily enzyme
MKIIKNIVKYILNVVNRVLFPSFDIQECTHNKILILQCGLIQKIIGVNRHVPWPVHFTSRIGSPEKIKRGTRTPGLAACCHIDARNGIEFGDNVRIGPRVSIISMNHNVNDYNKYTEQGPIIIQRNCWLAANSVILPGVELGEHTIVAAGAVVTRSFPEGNLILAGVPALAVKKLEAYES